MSKLFAALLLTLGFSVQASTCVTSREIFLENKETKVWKTVICPQQKLPFHTHEFARVVIPENDGVLKVIYRSGKSANILLKKHIPTYLSVEQGRESHQDINVGRRPLEVTVIELRPGKK